jgi:cation diffusion facilitator family transporter
MLLITHSKQDAWMTATHYLPREETRKQVRRVLLITLILNLAVATGKIILGAVTGALAITADGLHSITDSTGNVAGLIATAFADRPADHDHPYGHRRFETLAALLIGALLLLTAWEMLQGVLERLRSDASPEITPLTFVVMIVTLFINIAVSTYQIRQGKRLNSEILLADAQNTRADVFVTLSVIVSMALVLLTGWGWIDIVAALLVAALIGHAAWGILKQTGSILVDTAPYQQEQLIGALEGMPQSFEVLRARSRGSQDAAHIDIDVRVAPEMTAEQSNHIADAIRGRLETELHQVSEVEVHFVADLLQAGDPALTARALADTHGLATHEVQISHDEHGALLELHVEVPARQTLAEAHEQVTQLEADLAGALPQVDRILTHIEPAQVVIEEPDGAADSKQLEALVEQTGTLLHAQFPGVGWHDICARSNLYGFALSLHAALPAQISVEAAHDLAETAEALLRAEMPDLVRITIHTEPYEHA